MLYESHHRAAAAMRHTPDGMLHVRNTSTSGFALVAGFTPKEHPAEFMTNACVTRAGFRRTDSSVIAVTLLTPQVAACLHS